MAKKAMATSLVIVVTAVVLLVVALVLISIFGIGIGQATTIMQARNTCINTGAASCQAFGTLPPTWNAPMSVMENGKITQKSCTDLYKKCDTCNACDFQTPTK
jgi:hypothetical protein